MRKAILRLSAEYSNLGDVAIDVYGIKLFSRLKSCLIIPRADELSSLLLKHVYRELNSNMMITRDIDYYIFGRGRIKGLLTVLGLTILLLILGFLCKVNITQKFLDKVSDSNSNLKNLVRFSKTLCNSNYLVFSGGGYINTKWLYSLVPIIVTAILFKILNPLGIIVLGTQSIGPIDTRKRKIFLKILLKLINEIQVRGMISKVVAEELTSPEKIKLSVDWGFKVFRDIIKKETLRRTIDKRGICLHVRPWVMDKLHEYAKLLKKMISNKSGKLLVILMDNSEKDYVNIFIENLQSIKVVYPKSLNELVKSIMQCDEVISSSYHLSLLSLALGKMVTMIVQDDYYLLKALDILSSREIYGPWKSQLKIVKL